VRYLGNARGWRWKLADKRHVARRATLRDIDTTRAAVIVVVAGLIVIAGLGYYAMHKSDDMAPVASAAFGVIGSVIGAFFGVHAAVDSARRESDNARAASEDARTEARAASEHARTESTKTQRMLVSMMDSDQQKQEMYKIIDESETRVSPGTTNPGTPPDGEPEPTDPGTPQDGENLE
jgi:hypothetical protein